MEELFSLLLFAVLFFVMMRWGCGAHMVHGHGGHGGHRHGNGGATDPVCGMKVGADSGYSKFHGGTRYLFCSRTCLDKFDAEQDRYLRPRAQEGGGS